jgi:26S proteasome regulatory subunit N2
MQRIEAKLTEIRSKAAESGSDSSDLVKRYDKVTSIISGTWPIRLSLDFLHFHKATDLLLLKNIKDSFDARVSMLHSATVMANAFMHAGTTADTFLRNGLEWLGSATNWAKFGATASLGVIHRGHLSNVRDYLSLCISRVLILVVCRCCTSSSLGQYLNMHVCRLFELSLACSCL